MQENCLVFEDLVMRRGKKVLSTIQSGIAQLSGALDQGFCSTVKRIATNKGHLLVSGVGKSAVIAKKLSATSASLGMPSFFLHPTEMGHGDLGNVTENDLLVLVSNSGETKELIDLLPSLRSRVGRSSIIVLVGNRQSTLAQHADYVIATGILAEACHLALAPTTSTTASLVLGDALLICAAEASQFTHEDFAKSHPSGRLGQLLTLRVADVMLPRAKCVVVSLHDTVMQSVLQMAEKGQSVALVESEGVVVGIQPYGLIQQARVLNPDLSKIDNSKYLLPVSTQFDAHTLLRDVVAQAQSYEGRYFSVCADGDVVGLFDVQAWVD
jgi:arabinose-5-phosphate isomerase